MKKLLLLLLCWSITLPALASSGELLVFYHQEDHLVTRDLLDRVVPELRNMAASQDIELKLVDASQGAPDLVTATPAIVFQNHLGRSLYTGRYTYVDKVKTFVRTVRRMPQQPASNAKHDVLVWQRGRGNVYSPVKIPAASGQLPRNYDEARFSTMALAALERGMPSFDLRKNFEAQRTDRAMYLAFYPYFSADGQLFVSAEMYSQFNCVDPVFKRFDKPFQGKANAAEALFEEIGKAMEAELRGQLANPDRGDGLLPLAADVPVRSWEEMGLPLPPAPEGDDKGALPHLELPLAWTVDGPAEADVPLIAFHFMAPVDYYAGEINRMSGGLFLTEGGGLSPDNALFTADMTALTMGDPDLDEHVHEMIALVDYPAAHFRFRELEILEHARLAFGQLSQLVVHGEMEFMGVTIPLDVTAQIEPVLNDAGAPRLQVYCAFRLRLKENFSLDGPDGPEEAADTMLFNLNFNLRPAA